MQPSGSIRSLAPTEDGDDQDRMLESVARLEDDLDDISATFKVLNTGSVIKKETLSAPEVKPKREPVKPVGNLNGMDSMAQFEHDFENGLLEDELNDISGTLKSLSIAR